MEMGRENEIILNDRSQFYPPLTITHDGNQDIFYLKDIQGGPQRQVSQMPRWNGNQSFTPSEMLTKVEGWLNELR